MINKIYCLIQDFIASGQEPDEKNPSFLLLRLRINAILCEKVDDIIKGKESVTIEEIKSKLI